MYLLTISTDDDVIETKPFKKIDLLRSYLKENYGKNLPIRTLSEGEGGFKASDGTFVNFIIQPYKEYGDEYVETNMKEAIEME